MSLLFSLTITSVNAVEVIKEAKITGLYVAYFNRAADQEGLKYWTDKSDEVAKAGGNVSSVFKKLSGGFATHPAFKSTYDHLNSKEFVSLIYRNALGRDGDAEGIAYWTKKLDNEGMIRSDMVSDFVELSLVTDLNPENYPNLSAEELAAGQLRQDLITNKATVALAFTGQLGVLSNVVDSQDPEDDPAYLASIKIISEVTEDVRTVSSVLAFLESIKGSEYQISQILGIRTANSPMILSLITDMGDANISDVLIPGKKTVVRVSDLTDTRIKVETQSSERRVEITPQTASVNEDTITFITPAGLESGSLWIRGADFVSAKINFSVSSAHVPYITSISPDIASAGDEITINVTNLPVSSANVIFEGKSTTVSKNVTPVGGKLTLAVPDEAVSGSVYLQFEQFKTNTAYLSVKRSINVKVNLSPDVNINAADIHFLLGLEENSLAADYTTTLNVEKNDLQYLHATYSLTEETASVLYSSVVLPDMQSVTVDTKSTAIAMIFMGMGTSIVSNQEEWRSIYDKVASNRKVQSFADYIGTLQKNNFSAWVDMSDTQLMEKYQDAFEDVITTHSTSIEITPSTKVQSDLSTLVIIKQNPENGEIYVDDYIYIGPTSDIWTPDKLNNGSVNIINDTRLFLSIEARDKEDGTVINGYKHLSSGYDSLPKSLIKPKGWAITGFSEIKSIKLDGIDTNLEIVTAGSLSTTNKPKLSEELRMRVMLEGVFAPGLNMFLGALLDKPINKTADFMNEKLEEELKNRFEKKDANNIFQRLSPLPKRILTAMSDIYGSGFEVQLALKISQGEYTGILNEFLLDPIKAGFNDCLAGKLYKSSCENLAKGLMVLSTGYSVNDDNSPVHILMTRIAIATEKKLLKEATVLVPYFGWVMRGAFYVYDKISDIADTATIGESLYDMQYYPKQIDVDIDFPLEVSSVNPTCIGVTPTTQSVTMELFGEGFSSGDPKTLVEIGEGHESADGKDYFVNALGDQMIVHYDAQDLISVGSWTDYLYVGYGDDFRIEYSKPIRIIDQQDKDVYFDAIEPATAYLGETVTLKGCGWLPLNDIKVWFKTQDGYIRAKISDEKVDSIKAIVPSEAISGDIFVESGLKRTNKRFFIVNSFNLIGADTNSLENDHSVITFNGHSLDDAEKIYFVDHEGKKLKGEILFSSDDSLRATMPDGLKHGSVRIYAQQSNDTISNELILPLVPKGVEANPSCQGFEESIMVTFSQEEDLDIFYRIGNGAVQRYAAPLILKSNTTVHAFARDVVDGKNYDSEVLTYQYSLCGENEILQNGECIVEGETTYNRCSIEYRMKDIKHLVSTGSGGNTETWEVNGTLRNDVTLKGTFTTNKFTGTYIRKQTLSKSIHDDDCTATVTLNPDQNKVLRFSLACNESTVITHGTDSDYLSTYDIANNINGQNINEFTFADGFVFRTIGENTCNSVILSKHTVKNVTQSSGSTTTVNSYSTDRYCDEDSFIWIKLWTE